MGLRRGVDAVFKIRADEAHVARIVQQEGVVAVGGVDFGVGHVAAVVQQRPHDFAAAGGGKAPVGGKAHEQKARLRARQRGGQAAAVGAGGVEVVQRAGDEQVGVGVEVIAEFFALVAQIAFTIAIPSWVGSTFFF